MDEYITLNKYAEKYGMNIRQLYRLREKGFVKIVKVEDLKDSELKQKAIERRLKMMVVDRPPCEYTDTLKAIQPELLRGTLLVNEGLSILKKILEKCK